MKRIWLVDEAFWMFQEVEAFWDCHGVEMEVEVFTGGWIG